MAKLDGAGRGAGVVGELGLNAERLRLENRSGNGEVSADRIDRKLSAAEAGNAGLQLRPQLIRKRVGDSSGTAVEVPAGIVHAELEDRRDGGLAGGDRTERIERTGITATTTATGITATTTATTSAS